LADVGERIGDRALKQLLGGKSRAGLRSASRASKRSSAAKNRATSSVHACGGSGFQTCVPSLAAMPQSSRSLMWARMSAGVRVEGPARNAANSGGAPRTALLPR
jgi:hypothetical protein